MPETRFWMIRHALVAENARAVLYGTLDVELCPHTLEAQGSMYAALAARLPQPACWYVTPLSRTTRTAAAIWRAGYPEAAATVEPGLIEQSMGEWHGTRHADVPAKLSVPAHPFWPLGAYERPPGGESIADVIERVGVTMERLAVANQGQDVVIVSHGGTIRAAIAHALGIGAENALHLSVENLALTRLERFANAWRVTCVNDVPGL